MLSSWQSYCKSSHGSFDEYRMAPRLRLWVCLYRLPESTPTITIYYYLAKSWNSFYHPMEGRRLSRPSWLVSKSVSLLMHSRHMTRLTKWTPQATVATNKQTNKTWIYLTKIGMQSHCQNCKKKMKSETTTEQHAWNLLFLDYPV